MLNCYFCPGFVFVVRRKTNEKWAINFEKIFNSFLFLFMCINSFMSVRIIHILSFEIYLNISEQINEFNVTAFLCIPL